MEPTPEVLAAAENTRTSLGESAVGGSPRWPAPTCDPHRLPLSPCGPTTSITFFLNSPGDCWSPPASYRTRRRAARSRGHQAAGGQAHSVHRPRLGSVVVRRPIAAASMGTGQPVDDAPASVLGSVGPGGSALHARGRRYVRSTHGQYRPGLTQGRSIVAKKRVKRGAPRDSTVRFAQTAEGARLGGPCSIPGERSGFRWTSSCRSPVLDSTPTCSWRFRSPT